MLRYLLQRLMQIIPVLLGISCITFGLMHLTPGDPAEIMLRADGIKPTLEATRAARHALVLDGPIHMQFVHWLYRVFHLDLGKSYRSGLPVWEELMSRFPATVLLSGSSLLTAILIALPLGIGSALYPGSLLDRLGRACALFSVSMPGYWLGLLLIYYGAVKLKWFPMMGMEGWSSVILPACTLGFGMAGIYIRLIRTSLLEVLGKLYIKAARAKGLREWQVISGHALRNALLPSLTLLGIHTGGLLGGSVIVESIFSWPGIGRYAVEAIFAKDYTVIQGYVLIMAVAVVLINVAVDLLHQLLNPRIRLR
ncbi:nickel transporter permease NikB [Paenibacillus jilunlii]|uniref:Nickel import system permease protein NikB n=1 Tax=Paenibacillus jilunlii TaxID=682956 RepID=A0ABR5SN60_9BACL|nr:nickel transporter permease NikB [Paenibacillus jilunlii]